MDYKIILGDLDGTLLDSCGKISKQNFDAIEKLFDLGVDFVPASGRTLCEMPKQLVDNDNIRYIIYSNGAAVYDKITGKKITFCMPDSIKNELVDLIFNCDSHLTIRFDGMGYVDKNMQTEEHFDYYSVNPEHKSVILNYAKYCDDFENVCRNCKDAEVMSVFFKHLKDRDKCISLIEKSDTLGYANIYENNLEIFSLTAGKGNALKALCEKLGVDIEKAIATGDSDNDCQMLKMAGLGLVPSNAPEVIKNVGDKVICSNDEHIAQYILNNYIV